MTDPEAARYLLPEAKNQSIFRQRIVPRLLEGRTPQDTPSVVFLVGQPGAGKSRVTRMVADTLNQRGGFVDVDSDLYKPFHLEYDALMQRDDTLMAAYTRADGRAWMAQAHEYVRENKLNAVIQETSQNGAAVAQTMQAYRAAGFKVEVMAMGVPAAQSNQGILNRYYEQLADRGQGRLTVQANADQSYSGILDLADRVDYDKLADAVGVFRRGEGEPRYSNEVGADGEWIALPALRQAIETERIRPWTTGETQDFTAVQDKLRAAMNQENEELRPDVKAKLQETMGPQWSERLDVIDAQARPLIAPPPAQPQPPEATPEAEQATPAVRPALPQQASRETPDKGVTQRRRVDDRLAEAYEERESGPKARRSPPAPRPQGPDI